MFKRIPKTDSLLSHRERSLLLIFCLCVSPIVSSAQTQQKILTGAPLRLTVTASFTNRASITPKELIALRLSRIVEPSEGALAVFVDQTDITSLFNSTPKALNYASNSLPLPTGENILIVYLVSPANEWNEIGRFSLVVRDAGHTLQNSNAKATASDDPKKHGFDKFEINPSLALNVKSESTLLFFPETNRPARINFTNLAFQASIQTNLVRGSFNSQNQFDFVGTTSQTDAIRFGERNNDAPQIDLSSYQMQFQVKKVKVSLGHHSYGTNRYLINGFSSRGVDVTLPLSSRFDVSFNAVNGTSIVGWNNFTGLNRQKHKVIAGTLGSEFFPAHPGWLRLEIGVLRGSLLPLSNFNQQNLADAETSRGLGARIVASDSKGRLRLDAGYARSRFDNPADTLLSQGFNTVPVRVATKNANYIDFSYQILKDRSITKDAKANLTFAFRHNRVDPLFRSVAVYSQADRLDNQYELTGNFGEITAGIVHNRLNDNLDDVPSILKTLTRRNGFSLGGPLTAVFGNTHSIAPWLPRLAYNYDRTHAFGAFLPINSGFALSHVPDQASINHNFNADWSHNSLRFGYRFNRSFQDNRQVGRDRADFRTVVNALAFGFKPFRRLETNFDLSSERASNLEVNRLDRALRLGLGLNLQTTKKSILAANVSSNLASDAANTNKNRSLDLDLQWSWRFGVEKDKYRKVQGQFFIRYANRYARAQDQIFLFNNITKFQSLSSGLSLTFF